jgi:hypothetical protein
MLPSCITCLRLDIRNSSPTSWFCRCLWLWRCKQFETIVFQSLLSPSCLLSANQQHLVGWSTIITRSSSTFTVAYAQHQRPINPTIRDKGGFDVGYGIETIFIDPNDHIYPSNTLPDIHGLAGHK